MMSSFIYVPSNIGLSSARTNYNWLVQIALLWRSASGECRRCGVCMGGTNNSASQVSAWHFYVSYSSVYKDLWSFMSSPCYKREASKTFRRFGLAVNIDKTGGLTLSNNSDDHQYTANNTWWESSRLQLPNPISNFILTDINNIYSCIIKVRNVVCMNNLMLVGKLFRQSLSSDFQRSNAAEQVWNVWNEWNGPRVFDVHWYLREGTCSYYYYLTTFRYLIEVTIKLRDWTA